MRLKRHKDDATALLGVPSTTPVSDMLDMMKERFKVIFEKPANKLEQARLLHAIASRMAYR